MSLLRVLAAVTLALVLLITAVWILWGATRPPSISDPPITVGTSRSPLP
jgi:hypothetical protein